jgi:hypothetical protein
MAAENLYASSRDRFRFSKLYLPGNSPECSSTPDFIHLTESFLTWKIQFPGTKG